MDARAAIKTSRRLLILATLISTLSLLLTAPSRANFDDGLAAFGAGRMQDARVEWQKCASKGHNISRFLLGQLYEEGQGVEADIVLAHKWYCLAASDGYEEAISYCARVERAMTDDQKNASFRLLQATMPTPRPDAASSPSRQAVASTNNYDDGPADAQAMVQLKKRKAAETTPASKPAGSLNAQVSSTAAAVKTANSISDASVAIVSGPTRTAADASADAQLSGQPEVPDTAKGVKFDQSDEDTLAVQKLLGLLGHYSGTADGLMGRNTRLAIVAFKTQVGLAADDKIDAATVSAIRQHIANMDGELTSAPVTTGSAVESSLVKPSSQADTQ